MKKWRLGAILLAVVVFAGALTGMAFANSDQNQTDKPDFTAVYQSFISKFAANLGVSEDQVKEALNATKKQMLEEAVEQGRLTQEQADKMLSNEGFGFFGFGPGRGHFFGGPGGPGGRGGRPEDVAKILGITVDELKTQLDAGKRIEDIVTGHGMTMDQFREKMQELRKTAPPQQ
ncbi:MAG: Fis family transcriptional regulator [Peptococcaceae bacterium]|nr:Fis family transcriptional regulator [Peptococcaceae bacterium]